jgi:hypothetical protein
MNEDVVYTDSRIASDPGLRTEWLRQDNLIYGGLIAGSVAIVQPFMNASTLDLPATIAVVSFAVAIPLLAALLMLNQQEAFRQRLIGMRLVSIAKIVGQGLAVLGMAAAFWHVSWIAGAGLLASALVATGVHAAGYVRLEGTGDPTGSGER